MNLFYHSKSEHPPPLPVELPRSSAASEDSPAEYVADEGLVHAVNTALLLGRPLLVTGEPGTGKTQLAASIAYQLGYGTPLSFVAKSTSQAQDLFYMYDALGRFKGEGHGPFGSPHQVAEPRSPVEFISYNALGRAILDANPRERVAHLLPSGLEHRGPRRSVVLIDEIDKAPRDFPNDLLVEIEHMGFRIAELGASVATDPEWRPVVVVTSNSERGLPDAFLRRCIYYDIPFPTSSGLDLILQARLGALYDRDFATAALDLFSLLRSDSIQLNKPPSTAELIGWMIALLRRAAYAGAGHPVTASRSPPARNPLHDRSVAVQTLGALVKSREDLRNATPLVERWARRG